MSVSVNQVVSQGVAHRVPGSCSLQQPLHYLRCHSNVNSLYKKNVRFLRSRINASSSEPQQVSSYRVSLFDAMKVFGPAPERINCRLAMLMFIPMVLREMETSETILEQFANPDYTLVALCLVTVYASMIPILKGVKDEDFGFMKVSVEKINGRLAMLAWLATMGLEHYAGDVCFF